LKKLAIISSGNLHSEPRVLMEINALNQSYELVLFGKTSTLTFPFIALSIAAEMPRINFHFSYPAVFRKIISVFVNLYILYAKYMHDVRAARAEKENLKKLVSQKPDLVVLHGIHHLPWVSKAIDELNCPLILNMHEYYPLEFEDDAFWMRTVKPEYDDILRRYAKKAKAYFVVCDSIIQEYSKSGFTNQFLIRNTKPVYPLQPKFNGVKDVHMIHHGVCNASRKIELTIESMKHLPDNYFLDLMLVPDRIVFPKLLELAKSDKRIRFLDPVPTKQIPEFINSYDIGLFLLPPSNFNYLNALPNKLFEFIQARLAIVVSPNPEMKALVEQYEMGVVSKDYSAEEFAKAIRSIDSDKLKKFKINTDKAAREINDEKEQLKIKEVVDSLI
jgi:glycosyltransferase involved in cell wall biosynthesis